MAAPFQATFDAIEVFVRGILPRAEVKWVGHEHLHVRSAAQSIRLTFNRSQLDDFEVVLRGDQPVQYSNGIRSDLYIPVYVALGIEGMIPDLRISSTRTETGWHDAVLLRHASTVTLRRLGGTTGVATVNA
jgi:hypothetical protein